MTAFVDFESALIGMVSRNSPVSELVHGGVAVCMHGLASVVSGWGQDLPTTGPVSSTDNRYGQCYQNPLPRVQWLLIVSAPEHLNYVLGYFSSYLWPHCGDLLVRTLQWPLLIGYMCIVSILKMLSRFALGEKVDTRRWREGCDSRCRGLVYYLAISCLTDLYSFDQVSRCLKRSGTCDCLLIPRLSAVSCRVCAVTSHSSDLARVITLFSSRFSDKGAP